MATKPYREVEQGGIAQETLDELQPDASLIPGLDPAYHRVGSRDARAARAGEGILRTHGWPAIQFDRCAVEVLAIDVAARGDGPGARSEVFHSTSEAGRARWPR